MDDRGTWRFRDAAASAGFAQAMRAFAARRAHKHLGLHIVSVWAGQFRLEPDDPGPMVPEGCHLRRLRHDEVSVLQQDERLQIDTPSFEYAFANEHMPLGLFIEDRLVHYTIFGHTAAPGPPGLMVRLRPGILYIWRTFTHPDFRGQHLLAVRAHLTRVHWHELGWTRALGAYASYVDVANQSSITGTSRRLRDELIGYAGYWRLGTKLHTFRSPGTRRLGLSFDEPRDAAERRVVHDSG